MADPDYFTLAELRALPDMNDTGAYPEAKILAAAAFFTKIVEREIGTALIPRTFTETLDGNNLGTLVLGNLPVRSLTSVTVNGTAVATAGLGFGNGILRYVSSYAASGQTWTKGIGNVVVTYVAGEATVPADIKNAVMWATRDRLLSQNNLNGIDVRRTSMTNDLGGTVSYVLPGEKRPTGYPELDALIASYVRTTPSLGFA